MPDLLLASIEYGGYISPFKFVVFIILFFPWLLLICWVHDDAKAVGTREQFWTAVVLATGAAAAIIWMLIPIFTIGMLFYLIAVGATSISYVMHRNTKVPDFERVLTVEHIKGLFSDEAKKLDAGREFIFITANNNEVPLPESKTPEFYGYKAAFNILTDATWRRASDIVFSPAPENYNVTYYVDGAALQQPSIAKDQMEYLARFIKNLADLDPDQRRKPQKGRFRVFQNEQNVQWEVVTAGSTAGEQVRIKPILHQTITRLTEIGLTPDQFDRLNRLSGAKQGLFIVGGPKKTGVTTTFYALLRNHDAFVNSINTLERQLTSELPNIGQNVFALSDTGTTTYAKKLLSIVRMGPDIVGVAGCQDAETAQVACSAAKDNKIVYVAMEADSVVHALGKWLKWVGDKNLAIAALTGACNQRLIRKLCDECKQAYEPNKEILRKFNLPAEKVKVLYREGKVQYDKRGKPSTCKNCQGTGFVGRTAVFEVITMNAELKKAIIQAKSLAEVSTHLRRAKMLSLQEQTLKKVIAGTTSINEMVRVFSTAKKQKHKRAQ